MKTASGLILCYMNIMGFDGWASLWNVIYLRPGCKNDQRLIRHEQKHLEQMRRDGKFWFMVKYIYWWALYGYAGNPYEIEARKAETNGRYSY